MDTSQSDAERQSTDEVAPATASPERTSPGPDVACLRWGRDAARDVRIRVPFLFVCACLLLLSGQRLLIFATMGDRFARVALSDVIKSFVTGLRYDLMVSCCLVVPVCLVLMVAWPRLVERRWFRGCTACYCAVGVTLVLFTCIVDTYFFKEFDERLDHKAIDYLGASYVRRTLLEEFPLIPAMLVAVASLAGLARLFLRLGFAKNATFSLCRALTWPVVAVPVLCLAVRSSVGPKAINSGLAYFSDSLSLAQLTLNGLFSLGETINSRVFRQTFLTEYLDLLSEEDAFAEAARVFVRPSDTLTGDPANPLRRITDTGRPRNDYNVVVVIMESLSWQYIGAMGGDSRLSPELDQLAAHGVLMDRCFAIGSRTRFAISGILCGFPDLPGDSVTVRSEAQGSFFTLGHVLQRRGYETLFMCGQTPLFDHLQAFLRSNGFGTTVFEDDFDVRTFRTHLGWCDDDLFTQAHRTFVDLGDRPFLAVLLTLSFHRPYEIPDGTCEAISSDKGHDRELTCARYSDWAIGRFIERARRADYFDRTLFVFVADHTGGPSGNPITVAGYRVPFLIYAPGVVGSQGRRVSAVCSQTDVSPTIMSILGGSYEHCFFGSNALDRPAGSGMAMMQRSGRAIALMAGDESVVIIPFGGEMRAMRYRAPDELTVLDRRDPSVGGQADRLRRQGIAAFQAAEAIFARGAYNLRER